MTEEDKYKEGVKALADWIESHHRVESLHHPEEVISIDVIQINHSDYYTKLKELLEEE